MTGLQDVSGRLHSQLCPLGNEVRRYVGPRQTKQLLYFLHLLEKYLGHGILVGWNLKAFGILGLIDLIEVEFLSLDHNLAGALIGQRSV